MVLLTDQQTSTIEQCLDIWLDAVIDREFSKVRKIHITWILIHRMLDGIDFGRECEEYQKPRDCTAWSKELQDDMYPLAWNWMMNLTYYEIHSCKPVTSPPPPNLNISDDIDLSPEVFKSTVISECLTYFMLEDIDSTASQFAQSVPREQAGISAQMPVAASSALSHDSAQGGLCGDSRPRVSLSLRRAAAAGIRCRRPDAAALAGATQAGLMRHRS